jgi:hypothetical protein
MPGSYDLPNMQRDWDFLPGMKKWDGIPFHDFLRVWWVALCVALGSISQDGVTLLQTADGTDADPGDADANAKRKYLSRSARVFACMSNYLKPDCRALRIARQEFPNDGPAFFKWLKVYGTLDYDEETLERMRREFDVATMAKVGIKFEPEAIYEWLEWIEEMGDKLNKSLGQRRKRFLEGFPSSFEMIVGRERMVPDPGSFTIDATYPPHHPKSGQAHPDAGKPDLDKLVAHLEPEWTSMCIKGIIKPVPRGFVYAAGKYDNDEPYDDDDNVVHQDKHSMPRKVINDRYICVVCGGRGHAPKVDGMECLTKQLGIYVPHDELKSTIYPNGLKFPHVKDSDNKGPSKGMHARKQLSNDKEQCHDSDSESQYSSSDNDTDKAKPKLKSKSPHLKKSATTKATKI